MQEQNKINTGIAGFMQTQSLFRKQLPRTNKLISTTKTKSNRSTDRNNQILTANKYIQFDIPVQPKRDSSINPRKDDPSPIRDESFVKNPQDHIQSRIHTMQTHSEYYDQQINQSKKKYFETCRKEASKYAEKISSLLNYNLDLLETKIQEVRLTAREHSNNQKQKVRAHLYRTIDQCIEEWQAQHNKYLAQNQIFYIGDLLELQSQIQNRIEKINEIVIQLNSPKQWKRIAGELLSSSYEEQASLLSQQCLSSIRETNHFTKKMLTQDNEKISFELHKVGLHSELPGIVNNILIREVGSNSLAEYFKTKIIGKIAEQRPYRSVNQ